MSSYYKQLLQKRDRIKTMQILKNKAIVGLGAFILIVLAVGIYFYLTNRETIALKLGDSKIHIQVVDALKDEIEPKLEKFSQNNDNLKISCEGNCDKPDILIDIKKHDDYKYAEGIGEMATPKSKFKFKSPDTFVLSNMTPIWIMSRTGGTVVDDLCKDLKSYYDGKKTVINFVGDIMLSRTVDQKIEEAGNFKLPFLFLADFLKSVDLTVGNLESPFFDQGYPVRSGMILKANPQSVAGLAFAGFNILSLANNHFGDQGTAGMEYTFDLLNKNKIEYIGAGKNLKAAEEILVKKVNGIKIAFLGVENYSVAPENSYATSENPGILHVKADQISKYVKRAKKKADIVIVYFHGGTEYEAKASTNQVQFAHNAIDAGADLVIGHHPHVVQNVENYKGKFIIYSLGNFVFDQMWSVETQQGLIAKVTLSGKAVRSIKLVPIRIYNYCQPQKCSSSEKGEIIQRILSNSDL